MKKVFSLVIMLLFSGAVTYAQNAKPANDAPAASAVKFEHVIYDFGEIEYGGDGNHTFIFKNVSKQPVVIKEVSASCGCTTPSYSKEPVNPGKTGTVAARYDTTREGHFTKTLTVTINEEMLLLTIKGVVKPVKADTGN